MTESNPNRADEADLGYGQLFAVLLRRRLWLVGVLCSVLSITALITLITKPTYESSMQLLVESNYQEKDREGGEEPESKFADSNVEMDYATQLNLMRSSQVIQKAVDLLRLKYPEIEVEEIRESLILTQVVEEGEEKVSTKIFQADYTDDDPLKTQEVLELIQNVYQDYNREQQQQRLANGLAFIDRQLPAANRSVAQAEAALKRFRETHNLIDPEQWATDTAEALKTIEQERRSTRAQYQQSQKRYTNLQQQLDSSPQDALVSSRLSESTRYQELLNEIQKTELSLAQERLRFGDAHPQVQALLTQRQDQLALLKRMGGVLGRDPAQLGGKGEGLLKEGQLGETELDLASQLVEAQTDTRSLRARDQSLAQAEQQLRAELGRFPALLAEHNRLQPQVEIKRETLQQLLRARQELSLEIARGDFVWQVVEAPQRGEQISPNVKLNLLMGVVVGLFLGCLAAFIREAVDDAVDTSDELKQQVDLPLLGITPELPRARANEPLIKLPFRKPQTVVPPIVEMVGWGPFRESLDLIYKNIELLNSTFPFRSLLVTSALAGEGKSTLALGLAISAARLHKRVLLIDADLRRPNLHKQLNLPNEQGLSTLLTSDAPIPSQSGIQTSGSYNISVLTSGPMPTDSATLLSSQRMRDLIVRLEDTYDLVLLDAPPVLGTVDAILAASCCSGVVMVGRIGQVTRTQLSQATDMLSKLNVIGIVANGANSSSRGYAYYGNAESGLTVPSSFLEQESTTTR